MYCVLGEGSVQVYTHARLFVAEGAFGCCGDVTGRLLVPWGVNK